MQKNNTWAGKNKKGIVGTAQTGKKNSSAAFSRTWRKQKKEYAQSKFQLKEHQERLHKD